MEELILEVKDLVVVLESPYRFATSTYDTDFNLNESIVRIKSRQSSQVALGYKALFSLVPIGIHSFHILL